MSPAKAEPSSPDRLHEYACLFREDFRRRDQARWAEVYLRGLLGDAERKSIEPLAREIRLPAPLEVDDAAQALQNFINQSPWEEERLWKRLRNLMAERFAHPDGVFVIEDISFRKQGRHSVGVQRQYSRVRQVGWRNGGSHGILCISARTDVLPRRRIPPEVGRYLFVQDGPAQPVRSAKGVFLCPRQ